MFVMAGRALPCHRHLVVLSALLFRVLRHRTLRRSELAVFRALVLRPLYVGAPLPPQCQEGIKRETLRRLQVLTRIGGADNHADGILVEPFESAPPLQIFQVTA
jgi:hypothetical protein